MRTIDYRLEPYKTMNHDEMVSRIVGTINSYEIHEVIKAAANLAHDVLEELSIYRQRNGIDDPCFFDCEGEACKFLDMIDD